MALKLFSIYFIALSLVSCSKSGLYFFNNETQDHSYDDSVKVSIIAAYKRAHIKNCVLISDKLFLQQSPEKEAQDIIKKYHLKSPFILYLFSPQKKRLKIEVSYDLEGRIPDVIVHRLESSAEGFIWKNFYADFWAELINTLNIEVQNNHEQLDLNLKNFTYLSGGAGLSKIIYQNKDHPKVSSNSRSPKSYKEALETYLENLSHYNNVYAFNLYTNETISMRKAMPLSTYFLSRNARMYLKNNVDQFFENEKYGIYFFKNKYPSLPIIIEKNGQDFKINEVLSYSLFSRYENSNQIFLKFPIQFKDPSVNQYINTKLGNPIYNFKSKLDFESIINQQTSGIERKFINEYDLNALLTLPLTPHLYSAKEFIYLAEANLARGNFKNFIFWYEKYYQTTHNNVVIKQNLNFYKNLLIFKKTDWIMP